MTSLSRFTRFDIGAFATTHPARVLLPLAFVVVFGAIPPVPGLGIVAGAVIASVSASIPFQSDERGRLDTLYAIAPINRAAVVLGRYVTMLIFAVVAIGVGTGTALVAQQVRHQHVSEALLGTMLLVAFGSVCVAYAVQLPWFFALGFTRGRPMMYVPVALLALLGFIGGQTRLFDGVARPKDLGNLSAPVVAAILVGGIAVLMGSALVAIRLYRRREL